MLQTILGRFLLSVAFLLGTVLLLPAAPGGDLKKTQEIPKSFVKLSTKAGKIEADGRQKITIVMDIEPPWYAYANPVGLEDFEEAKTKVQISSKTKLEEVKISYPPGKRKMFDKDSYYAYENKVSIEGSIKRAKGDTGPLEVTVEYMTCNPMGQCLPPEKITLKVP